jgi:tetratricopeptide (TPR) repeat protein
VSTKGGLTRFGPVVIALLLAVGAALALWNAFRRPSLPQPGSSAYEEVTRAFYRGLAALEVGLLDDARGEFTRATERVPEEPASWANLGLARLRLGELDAAAEPIGRALALAPDNADLVLLAGRMEIARGRLDEGLVHLRRAVELNPRALQARFGLAEEVERAAAPDADQQAARLLDELAALAPDNPAIHVERARLAAKLREAERLNQAIRSLQPMAAAWPERALEQFRGLQAAAAAGDLPRAQLSTTFLRNVLASVPSFRESLSAVRTPTELIAEPIASFVALAPVSPRPAAPDVALTFAAERLRDGDTRRGASIAMMLDVEGTVAVLRVDPSRLERIDASGGSWPLSAPMPGGAMLVALDWNNDFRSDVLVVGEGGLRLLLQDAAGAFRDATAQASSRSSFTCRCVAGWSADVEMDGDLDIVLGTADADPVVLRNNGDGTWLDRPLFAGVPGARAFAWVDLDRDADPDAAFLDAAGALHVFINRQAGEFVRADVPGSDLVGLGAGDLDADGTIDLLTMGRDGALRRTWRAVDRWNSEQVLAWRGFEGVSAGMIRLTAADLDNNGGFDVVASGAGQTAMWLSDERRNLYPARSAPVGEVASVVDLDADGRLDLLATTAEGVWRHLNRGTAKYHWKVIRPRAQATAGDQRINSFGVGGDIEVRSGLLVQKQLLTGGAVHIGLGDRTSIDVARIVWPNGVAQAEFGEGVDDVLVAEQRLKGSCPWVFAWDGTRMRFVTDFLWRSPLGLRINAQDTAGVVQTEDWVRISGDTLAPRQGAYDIRITAELWETHYVDHLSLMVVDHPPGTDVFVDERFSPAAPPAHKVHVVERRTAVRDARDHRGADVTAAVARNDGHHLATFAKGRYQGIAEEHYVEFAPPAEGREVLLASGWIYPTDSSINLAIGQGGHVTPMGLVLEAQRSDGAWRAVEANLGFPAGKNKTIVIDLSNVGDATRLRLRTNLEIYWDALEFAGRSGAEFRTSRLRAQQAELRYRGFSHTSSPRGEEPETPDYDRIAATSQRWRDLTGYHTRFGDVKELLDTVDDRYVIMNAGDEMQVRFAEQPAPREGWRRDFVLIGDGWEKDGDYNTAFSQTVLPLPSHDRPQYGAGVTSLQLEDDPVYQRHKDDWQRYHTRYVTPQRFVEGLRAGAR